MGLLFVEDNGMVNLRRDNVRLHPFQKKKKKNVRLDGQDFGTKVGLLAAKYIRSKYFLMPYFTQNMENMPKKRRERIFYWAGQPIKFKVY